MERAVLERFWGKYNTSIDFQFGNSRLFFSNFNQRSIPNDFLCITINHLPSTFGRPDCSMIFCKFNPGHPGRHNQVVLHNRFEPGWLKGVLTFDQLKVPVKAKRENLPATREYHP